MSIATFEPRVGMLAVMTAAASLSSVPTQASAASSSASLTNISLTVVDLNLADGITAGFSFVDGLGFAGGHLIAEGNDPTDRRVYGGPGLTDPFVSVSGVASVPGVRASGAMTPSGFTLSASTAVSSSLAYGGASFIASLRLTPRTRLIATADYSVAASALDACVFGRCEQGTAQVVMLFEGDLQTDQFAFTQAVALPDGGVSYDGPKSGSLHMQVDNVGGTTANLRMNFFGNADAIGAVPAVVAIPSRKRTL